VLGSVHINVGPGAGVKFAIYICYDFLVSALELSTTPVSLDQIETDITTGFKVVDFKHTQ